MWNTEKRMVRLNGARIHYFPFYTYARKIIMSHVDIFPTKFQKAKKKSNITRFKPQLSVLPLMLSKKSFVCKILVTFISMIILYIFKTKIQPFISNIILLIHASRYNY